MMNWNDLVQLAATDLAEYGEATVTIPDDFDLDQSVHLMSDIATHAHISSVRVDLTVCDEGCRHLIVTRSTMMSRLRRRLASKLN